MNRRETVFSFSNVPLLFKPQIRLPRFARDRKILPRFIIEERRWESFDPNETTLSKSYARNGHPPPVSCSQSVISQCCTSRHDSRYSVVFRETATFPTTDTPQGSSRGFFVRSRNTVYYYCYLVPFFFSFLFLSPPPPTQSSSSSETKSFEGRFDRVSITIDSKRG